MNRYENFRTNDFVWDRFFRQWVLSPTSESDRLWQEWVQDHPERLRRVTAARTIVLALQVEEPELTAEKVKERVRNTMDRLQTLDSRKRQGSVYFRRRDLFVRIAAAILLISGLVWGVGQWKNTVELVLENGPAEALPVNSSIEIFNQSKQARSYSLSDGSRVLLQPGGKLTYQDGFADDHRTIYLVGTGFFEINRDTARPFMVYTRDLVTKVLGTSFTVEAEDTAEDVTVSVKTGKVLVVGKKDPEFKKKMDGNALSGNVLLPNQQIIFYRNDAKLVKTLVAEPSLIPSQRGTISFSFEETPVNEVFDRLAAAYGIEIQYDEKLLRNCPLTAVLESQNLHEKLDIICRAVESRYEIVEGQVIIHSKGCQ